MGKMYDFTLKKRNFCSLLIKNSYFRNLKLLIL